MILRERIEVLRLPTRALNCLRDEGIEFVADLVVFPDYRLLIIAGFGRVCLCDVKNQLADYGLTTGMSHEAIYLWLHPANTSDFVIRGHKP